MIKLNCSDGADEEEWCILEFQGELLGDMHPGANVGEILEIKVSFRAELATFQLTAIYLAVPPSGRRS